MQTSQFVENLNKDKNLEYNLNQAHCTFHSKQLLHSTLSDIQMYQTGALIVESGKLLLPALAAASRIVSKVLYIPLEYNTHLTTSRDTALGKTSQEIRQIYFEVSRSSPLLDVRVLLPPPPQCPTPGRPAGLQYGHLDIVLGTLSSLDQVQSSPGYKLLTGRVKVDLDTRYQQLEVCQLWSGCV